MTHFLDPVSSHLRVSGVLASGEWSWVNGQPIQSEVWGNVEPNGDGIRTVLHKTTYHVHDSRDNAAYWTLCETGILASHHVTFLKS